MRRHSEWAAIRFMIARLRPWRVGVIAGAAGGALTRGGLVKGAAMGGAARGLTGRTADTVQDASDAGFVVRKCLDGPGWTVLD